MKKYIDGLVVDIEKCVLERWNKSTPANFYPELILHDDNYIPPSNWVKPDSISPSLEIDLHLREVDAWIAGEGQQTMYAIFDMQPEALPKENLLSDNDIMSLTYSLSRLWVAHNFCPNPPVNLPMRKTYELMREIMHGDFILQDHSTCFIDFCTYFPPDCPLGPKYCDCQCDEEDDFTDDQLEKITEN